MDDVRLGDLLFTTKCDIKGFRIQTRDQVALGEVDFQVVDIAAYTVRYLGVKVNAKTCLIPAELILDMDENGLVMDFDSEKSDNLIPLSVDWQETFARDFEEKIYSNLDLTPYWEE